MTKDQCSELISFIQIAEEAAIARYKAQVAYDQAMGRLMNYISSIKEEPRSAK